MIFTHLWKARFAAEKMGPFVKFYDEVYGRGSELSAKWDHFYSNKKWQFLLSSAISSLRDDNIEPK